MKSRLFRGQSGSAMAVGAFSMFGVLLCGSLAIDAGAILAFKSQLQTAVDAAALAGARGLIVDEEPAMAFATSVFRLNRVQNRHMELSYDEVSFINGNTVVVQVTRSINLYFMGLIGRDAVNISASASAMFGRIGRTKGLKPWAVPDLNWHVGDEVVLKAGPPGNTPSWYYAVCFPPINQGDPVTGADTYTENITGGSSCSIGIGDQLLTEVGDMVGPTREGVEAIMAMDPGAYWAGDHIEGSSYPGDSSPRVCKIALIDPNALPEAGRDEVTVTRFGVFLIEGMQGQTLIGRYIRAASTGEVGGGESDIYGVKLVS